MSNRLEIWGVNDPNISAQLALACKLDLFQREAGLNVSCKFIESGTTMADDVFHSPTKPFAFTQTPITALLLRERGLSTKLLAPLADISGTQQVVVHESRGIIHPKDFEGKRVGMAKRAAIYLAMQNMAQDCDVDLAKVDFVDLLPYDQLAAFKFGDIDAMACWEPWTTKLQDNGGRLYFSGNHSEIPGMEGDINWLINQSCLIVPDEHIAARPEQIVSILNVLRKATGLINDYRKDIIKELAGFFGIGRVELLMAMSQNRYSLTMDNLFRLGLLEFRDFLYDNGQIASNFSEQMLYDTRLLREVDPSLVLLEETTSPEIPVIEKTGIYFRENVSFHGSGLDLKFLLADDSKYVRTLLTQTVDIIGGDVVGEAATGSEAIDLFVRIRPNVVTMDLSMPGVSGVDAIKRILQIDPNVNMIVVSGADLEEVRQEVFDLGVKIFITKPFDPFQVAEIIGLLLL